VSLVEIPFDRGMSEQADVSQLERGVFRVVENMRLDRDGRLVPRPRYDALSMGGVTLIDIWPYRDRLLGLGAGGALLPTSIFQYTGANPAWPRIGVEKSTGDGSPIPLVTDFRDLPRPPQQESGAKSVRCAAGGGYVCLVWNAEDSSGAGYVYIQRAADGATILYQKLGTGAGEPYQQLKCIYVDDGFIIGGSDSDGDIRVYTFRPLVNTSLQGPTDIHTSTGTVQSWAMAAESGSTTTFAMVVSDNQGGQRLGVLRHSFSAGTLSAVVARVSLDAVNLYNAVSICSDVTGSRTAVLARRNSNQQATLWTLSTAALATVAGPTTDIFDLVAESHTNNARDRQVSVQFGTSAAFPDRIVCFEQVTTDGSQMFVKINVQVTDTHADDTGQRWIESRATSDHIMIPLGSTRSTILFGGQLERFRVSGSSVANPRNFLGQWSFSSGLKTVAAQCDFYLAGRQGSADSDAWGNIALDSSTGLYYWAKATRDPISSPSAPLSQPALSEFRAVSTERRQAAELDGQLVVAGGLPLTYVGGPHYTDIGFEPPVLGAGTPSNGAGSLTNNATYNYCAVFKYIDGSGRVCRSPVSAVQVAPLGATDDTMTLIYSGPKTPKGQTTLGTTCLLEVYRTVYSDGVPGATFHLTARAAVTTFGTPITVVDVTSDANLVEEPILYTQSQTPVAHEAPLPCKYVAAGRSRLILGGLPDETAVQFSKLVFPGEPIEFALPGLLAFTKSIGEPVTAVFALDDQFIVASQRALYRIAGAGPDHSGQGEFEEPQRLPGLGGVSRWQSIAETPGGYFFQSSDDRLLFIDRGGAVSWAQGQAVRDTLATYPVVRAATFCRLQNAVFFACTDSAGTAGRLLVFDLRREMWYTDSEAGLIATVRGAVEHQGKLTLLNSSGNVYQEAPGTYLAAGGRVETGNIKNGSFASWNALRRIGIRGYGLDAGGSVTVSVDYDDGAGFVSLGAHTTAGTGPYLKYWVPGARKVDSFRVRIDAVDVALNALVLDIEPRRGHSRRAAGDQK
jgi:hypothetical protein